MNVFELAATLTLDDSEYRKKLDGAGKNVKGFGNTIKKALVPVAKTAASVAGVALSVTAITKAFIDSGKAAVEAYANYEQLAGGARLMFGSAYDTVAKNASEAYKTVQMSQNEYLQQVNGFAVGLKSSLGENEQAAAELAHRIVVAEADVVAATGRSQEAVQNAFNGIMRGNFVMLDNLQLGITPTKEGFQQVIDKVNEWNEANGKATKYQMDNYADMEAALVDYIEMVGLSEYAHREASTTIQGSLAMTRASWENLLVAMADGNVDVKAKTKELIDSAKTYVSNVAPVVWNYIKSIPEVFSVVADEVRTYATTKFNEIKEMIKGINWQEVGDKVITDITSRISGIVSDVRDWFTRAKNEIDSIDWEQAGRNIVTFIGNAFAKIGDTFRSWFTSGKEGIEGIDWAGAGSAILDFISSAWTGLKKWASGIWDEASNGIKSINWKQVGEDVKTTVGNAWDGLKEWASGLWENAKEGIQGVNWKQAGDKVKDAVGKAWDTLKSWAQSLWMKAKTGIQSVNWAEVATKIKTFISKGWNDLKGWASGIWMKAKTGIQSVKWAEVATKVQGFIEKGWSGLKEWASAIWMKAKTGIQSVNWAEAGGKVKTFISNAWSDLKSWASTLWGNAKDGIESISWTQVGNNIWGWIKTPLLNVASWFTDRFNDASAAIENIEWTQLGTNIWGFIKSAFSETIGWFFHLFDNSRSGIENNVEWEALGRSILNLITTGIQSIGDTFYGLLSGAKDTIKYDIDWIKLGDDLAMLIENGFKFLKDKIFGTADSSKDAVLNDIDWWRLGWDIVVAILDGMGGLAQGIYDHAANGLRRWLGMEEDWRSAGEKAVDAILHDWNRIPTDAKKQALKAAKAYLSPDDTDIWLQISAIVGDEMMEGIWDIPDKVTGVAKDAASKYGKNDGWSWAGYTAGSAVASGFSVAETEALLSLSRIQKAIDNIKGRKITITADIKAGANAKVNSKGQITPMARAMDRGYIYRHATIFGYDHENGTYQMAGDAGPEAVVGVHSLDRMIQNSVSHSVSSTQAAMVAVLTEILNVMPKGDLVLDTGALVGGIAGEMNGELERLTAWSGGGRA